MADYEKTPGKHKPIRADIGSVLWSRPGLGMNTAHGGGIEHAVGTVRGPKAEMGQLHIPLPFPPLPLKCLALCLIHAGFTSRSNGCPASPSS